MVVSGFTRIQNNWVTFDVTCTFECFVPYNVEQKTESMHSVCTLLKKFPSEFLKATFLSRYSRNMGHVFCHLFYFTRFFSFSNSFEQESIYFHIKGKRPKVASSPLDNSTHVPLSIQFYTNWSLNSSGFCLASFWIAHVSEK
mgnify:CR=1 FL=1